MCWVALHSLMLFVTNLRQWQPMFFGEVMKTKKSTR
ncbi:hypothetical protein GLYMA_17G191733v4 [Glycine max]|nr:hypothetical protein GLYMA_17G191733v4 [Glycine max]